MAAIRLALLGGFAARTAEGGPIALPTRKTEALFAYLALHAGQPVGRDRLLALLWSDRGAEQARNSLRQALTALRHAFPTDETLIGADRTAVTLRAGATETDVHEFERLAAAAAPAQLRQALDLYRGELLSGMALPDQGFLAWRTAEAARLHSLAIGALLKLSPPETGAAGIAEAAVARRLLDLDPLQEPAHRLLMRHYAQQGQRGLVLEQYETCRDALQRALGAAPSAETERLRAGLLGEAPPATAAAPTRVTPATPARPDRPSIAVMPFANLGDDQQQEYFADGIVEEVITALAHVPRLFVVGRGSTFVYKGRNVEPRRVAEELGVRYVLQGSVRRAADRVRIGGQLVDADTGIALWAERFEGALADVFDLQDRMSEAVVGAIAPRLEEAEIERARRKPPGNLDAWDLCLRAWPLIRTMERADQDTAIGLLRQALALDPRYALALGLGAWCYSLRLPHRWGTPQDNVREGLPLARRAIACGQDDAEALALGGYAVAYLGREYAAGLTALDRALAFNGNSPRGNTFAGWVRGYVGDHAVAAEHFQRALRLSPLDPMAFRPRVGLAFVHLFLGQLESAAEVAAQAVRQQPGFSPAYRPLAAALAHLGRVDEARAVVRQLEGIVPGITVDYTMAETRFTRPEDRERLESGLRLAGMAPSGPAVAASHGSEPPPHRPHVVVVDDEAGVRSTLADFLTKRDFAVSLAEGGAALRRILAQQPADLVLLDINMPGEDGLTLARYLRQETKAAIIMLTASGDIVDRVVGLEVGADDYVAKPFDLRELLARIRSVLRRTSAPAS